MQITQESNILDHRREANAGTPGLESGEVVD
jgi:hypothetical protein